MLSIDGIELNFTNGALGQLAENTLKLNTGARGLHTEIEKVLMNHMYNTKQYRSDKVTTLEITREEVLEPKVVNG